MSTQHDRDWEDCPLCGGAGEVSISKDGTYEGTDYYGCPMCISRERDEEARLIETQRDELRAVNAVLEMAARQLLEAVEDFEGYRQDIDTAIADLREALGVEPQPARQTLTDEELWKFWWARPEVPDGGDDSMETEFVAAVRRIIAAHGIGGEA